MRGDDGVGIRAAELAASFSASEEVAAFACEPSRVPEQLARFHGFVLIDALESSDGDPILWNAKEVVEQLSRSDAGSHGFGVVEAIRLMDALGTLPEKVLVAGIPAGSFDHGAEMSLAAQRAAHRAARLVAAVVRKWLQ